ncbi:lipase family protein [Peribacillus sp. SCS-37]|uniref:lipase family protein n=1 Tax=Paraperibacillus esterisolvens TaxID=3115296 RepID=UPI003905A1C2
MPAGTVKDKVYWQLSNRAYDEKAKPVVAVKINGEFQYWNLVKDKGFVTSDENGFNAQVYEREGEVIIAFRGTEKNSIQDIITDAAYIANQKSKVDSPLPFLEKVDKFNVLEKLAEAAPLPFSDAAAKLIPHLKENQFETAEKLVNQVKEAYPKANISSTGHSLGGAEAAYVSAKFKIDGVGYNAPTVAHLVSEKEAKNANFVNYVHPKDSVGAGAIGPYEKLIGTTYYIGSTFELENVNSTVLGRARNSFMGPNVHHLKHFTFNDIGEISNPLLTNAITGEVEYQSPRHGGETATIDLTPRHLVDLSKKLLEAAQGVENATNKLKMTASNLDNIKIYAGLQHEVLNEDHSFYAWFDNQTYKMANDLKSANDLFVKADKLP